MTDEQIERIMSSLTVDDMLILDALLTALEQSHRRMKHPQEEDS